MCRAHSTQIQCTRHRTTVARIFPRDHSAVRTTPNMLASKVNHSLAFVHYTRSHTPHRVQFNRVHNFSLCRVYGMLRFFFFQFVCCFTGVSEAVSWCGAVCMLCRLTLACFASNSMDLDSKNMMFPRSDLIGLKIIIFSL